MKKRVFSGARPTGRMHVGNYLGAVRNWVRMQDEYQCIYAVVDYHAMTTPYEAEQLNLDTGEMLVDLLASGIDPGKCTLIVQSQIPQHSELAWVLGTITPLGWLERVPTFKEKSSMHPDYVNLGLLSYPVLQAADIILYKAEAVPVGEDQRPHVELTREIVRRFNYMFGDTFPEPQVITPEETARIASLTEPDRKMSKSFGPPSYIAIGDSPEQIRDKIMKAVTDTGPSTEEMSPGVANLFLLLRSFGDEKQHQLFAEQYRAGTIRYVDLKEATADALAEGLRPIREKRAEILQDERILEDALERGRETATALAAETMSEVRNRIGLYHPR
ncbi:MAG: tryptophan--tRNA ligase [Bacillota bacterium]